VVVVVVAAVLLVMIIIQIYFFCPEDEGSTVQSLRLNTLTKKTVILLIIDMSTSYVTEFFIYLDRDSTFMTQQIITNIYIYKVSNSSVSKNILLQHLPYKTETKLDRHILCSRGMLHKIILEYQAMEVSIYYKFQSF
jgi:hypothetical protein